MLLPPPDERRRWLAAFFEKNGTIDAHLQRNGNRVPRIMVIATSKALLDQVRQVAACGRISGPYKRKGKSNTWRWTVVRRADVERLINMIRPLLSPARQKEVAKVLAQTDTNFRPPGPVPVFKPKPE